jgi:hypothetical protein
MNHSTKPPEALLEAVARDLKPVKPSPLPFQLALRMAPLAVVVLSVVVLLMGIRGDREILGPVLTWGASVAQLGLAVMLTWVAIHESTPAGRLSKKGIYLALIATSLAVVAVTWITYLMSPARGASRMGPWVMGLGPRFWGLGPWVMGLACGIGGTIAGGILVGLFGWMYRSSMATRPAVAGALYGAGAGVAINAGWRLACPLSDPWHALGAHGGAVIATALLGALVGRGLGGRRRS